MAYAVTNLTNNSSQTDATSYATASVTPTNGSVPIAVITTRKGTANPAIPTCSGNGLTWTQFGTVAFNDGTSFWRVTAFKGSGTPSAGAVTFSYGAETQLDAEWSVFEIADAPVEVQVVTNSGSGTTASATLAAESASGNVCLGILGYDDFGSSQFTATAGGGFTGLPTTGTGPNCGTFTEYKAGSDTVVDASLSQSVPWGMIAAEFGALARGANNRRLLLAVG